MLNIVNPYALVAGTAPPTYTLKESWGGTNQTTNVSTAAGNKFNGTDFTPATSYSIAAVAFWLYRSGSPTYNFLGRIYADDAGGTAPGTLLASTAGILGSLLPTSAAFVQFDFSTPYSLTSGVKYYMALTSTNNSGANYGIWTRGPTGTGVFFTSTTGATASWTNVASRRGRFNTYVLT